MWPWALYADISEIWTSWNSSCCPSLLIPLAVAVATPTMSGHPEPQSFATGGLCRNAWMCGSGAKKLVGDFNTFIVTFHAERRVLVSLAVWGCSLVCVVCHGVLSRLRSYCKLLTQGKVAVWKRRVVHLQWRKWETTFAGFESVNCSLRIYLSFLTVSSFLEGVICSLTMWKVAKSVTFGGFGNCEMFPDIGERCKWAGHQLWGKLQSVLLLAIWKR